ncbi:MAG: tetratricopeptide repeat protein [Xanthomonadales bacterium]|nr:tetratricopeptide repeat protein [Xanthomonadales bacterium]NIX13997.1 tetratricopeptide repeat protein [Xanthomonadales bacterium]
MVSRDDRPPTDADVMYKVFAGEVLGADGDLDKAADEYLEAAMQSSDPEIAERATRIALAARAWQHVAMASVRWVLLDPERLEAREIASRAMLLLGDYSGAEHQLGGIVDLLADDPVRAWTAVAGLLATANDPGRADVVLTRLIEQKGAGGNADALFAQSQFAARSGDLDRASALIREAMELSPERAELLAWAGRVEVNRGDEARALELYQAAHELQPTDRSIAMALAELMRRAGRTAEAQQVLAGLRDDPGTRFSRIAFALESGLRDLAVEIYLGFETAEYEDTVEAAFQAAQGAELLGRVDEALEWYARLDGTRRGLVSALRSAYLMADQGRLQDARNVLSRMRLRREPEVMQDSFQAEGQILLEAGALEDAFDLLSEGLEALPDNTALQYSRSLVAARMERVAVAEEDLRAIIAREPQNATALNALGYTLADLTDRYGEAEGYIRAAYELQPGEASIIDSMGWVAYRLGRLEESEQYLREAWNLDQNAEIAAHLGEVLWMQDRRDEAREAFASGLAVDAENEVLLETMDRLGVKP